MLHIWYVIWEVKFPSINTFAGLVAAGGFINVVSITVHRRVSLSAHGNAIVLFHLRSNFWNGQIGYSNGNGTSAYQFCFAFRRDRNCSVAKFSICLFTREQNDCVSSTFRITFSGVPSLGRNGSIRNVPI